MRCACWMPAVRPSTPYSLACGRILRAQASRKQIKEAISALQRGLQDEETAFATLQNVVERLREGLPMAPTLRELVKPDGSRVGVLDIIIQVKQTHLPDWTQVDRVPGFDWGVNVRREVA